MTMNKTSEKCCFGFKGSIWFFLFEDTSPPSSNVKECISKLFILGFLRLLFCTRLFENLKPYFLILKTNCQIKFQMILKITKHWKFRFYRI